ncbi:hypothetical protein MLD38_017686 [Melastoma candidum]|uniref:Uncharacterized protein n=1 Tax=Melastoma candidum TaxID=119954 RepID=A0ACB9QRZ9_9MYRT|nr:hypothetical protein MLD38_017686 [Melastoma candidum]
MGIVQSAHRRVKSTLRSSPAFSDAVDTTYDHCLSLTNHAFPGVFPYQLHSAASHLHSLSPSLPLLRRWAPSPPSQDQVDSALSKLGDEETVLGPVQFRDWAEEVFAAVVVDNAGRALATRVPIGVAGIVGAGAAARLGKEVVGPVIGVYALGVATSVLISLS